MSDIRYWIGFNRVPRIGPARLATLLDYFQSLEAAWNAGAAALRAAGLPQDALERLLYTRSRLNLDAELVRVEKQGLHLLTWESPDYPQLLRAIDHPPPLLYVRGEITPADEWAVAVVGTRHASVYGKEVARRLAEGLARNHITVVSGLALGIDGIAHQAALEAGGRTLAVLGCGLDTIYPYRHRDLAARICQAGALISDYPLGTRPEAGNFPPRNRIISGLSLGTLVIEAGERSGALITVRYALEQGRETFAVPGNVHHRNSAGTNTLIQRGEAKLVTRVEDILEELNLRQVAQQSEVREIVPDTPEERTLLAHIGVDPVHIDDLVRHSGLPTATVS
ncbi:MAG TPA: DNA-protecting protein DprA, partial [Chloroflexi bacterium]|nr:DNA-protecting protein DprA [Chloroflexota bacterium]